MKLHEIMSICAAEPNLLDEVFSKKEWVHLNYSRANFTEIVRQRDHEAFNETVPVGMVEELLSRHSGCQYLDVSQAILRSYSMKPDDQKLSYIEVFHKFGGDVLGEVIEKGSKKV